MRLETIHNPMRVMELSNRLRYSRFCIRSSARTDLLLVSHEALPTMQKRLPIIFLHLFLLINNRVKMMNARSRLSQSAIPNGMWPHQKDRSTRGNKSVSRVVIYIYIHTHTHTHTYIYIYMCGSFS